MNRTISNRNTDTVASSRQLGNDRKAYREGEAVIVTKEAVILLQFGSHSGTTLMEATVLEMGIILTRTERSVSLGMRLNLIGQFNERHEQERRDPEGSPTRLPIIVWEHCCARLKRFDWY